MTDNHSKAAQEDDVVENVLKHANRRRPAPEPVRRRAHANLHAHWQRSLQERRRRRWSRRAQIFGLAASLLVALGLVLSQRSSESITPQFVARVERSVGNDIVVLQATATEPSPLRSSALFTTTTLVTGNSSRAALRLDEGGSLRVDENSRLVLASARTFDLLEGAVYFDSHSDLPLARESGSLIINTAFGQVQHVGTQFEIRNDPDTFSLTVREGVASLATPDGPKLVNAGESLRIASDGSRSVVNAPAHGVTWQWIDNIVPLGSADGEASHRILAWIARETGRSIRYTSDKAAAYASSTPVTGIKNVTPVTMLKALSIAVDLEFEELGATIEVSLREPEE